MAMQNLESNFDIIRRFPVLRGARSAASSAASATSGAFDVEATSVELNYDISSDSNRLNALECRSKFRDQRVQHLSASPNTVTIRGRIIGDHLRSPPRQSFNGMPDQLVYGLFERPKMNVRYVSPQHWNPTNSSQAKSMIQVRNPTLAPIPHSELSRIVQEEKEEEMRARLHGSFRFKQEATTWPHNSLSSLHGEWTWQALSTRQRTKLFYDDVSRSNITR